MRKPTRGGVRLRAWMKKTGTTQKQLAEKLETVQQNVSDWLRGRPAPLHHAVAIRKLTKIPVEDWTVEVEAASGTDVTAPTRAVG